MIALISVIAALGPNLAVTLYPHSELKFVNPVIDGETLRIVAQNDGNKAAVFDDAFIFLPAEDKIIYVTLKDDQDAIIEPGTSLISAHLDIGMDGASADNLSERLYRLQSTTPQIKAELIIAARNHDGSRTQSKHEIDSLGVFRFLYAHIARCESLKEPPSLQNDCLNIGQFEPPAASN